MSRKMQLNHISFYKGGSLSHWGGWNSVLDNRLSIHRLGPRCSTQSHPCLLHLSFRDHTPPASPFPHRDSRSVCPHQHLGWPFPSLFCSMTLVVGVHSESTVQLHPLPLLGALQEIMMTRALFSDVKVFADLAG